MRIQYIFYDWVGQTSGNTVPYVLRSLFQNLQSDLQINNIPKSCGQFFGENMNFFKQFFLFTNLFFSKVMRAIRKFTKF